VIQKEKHIDESYIYLIIDNTTESRFFQVSICNAFETDFIVETPLF